MNIGSRLVEALVAKGFFPSLCTIQQRGAVVLDDYGHETTPWVDLHVAVPCATKTNRTAEVRGGEFTVGHNEETILLAGYYSDVVITMRAVVNGVAYNITGVDWDPANITTYVYGELIVL